MLELLNKFQQEHYWDDRQDESMEDEFHRYKQEFDHECLGFLRRTAFGILDKAGIGQNTPWLSRVFEQVTRNPKQKVVFDCTQTNKYDLFTRSAARTFYAPRVLIERICEKNPSLEDQLTITLVSKQPHSTNLKSILDIFIPRGTNNTNSTQVIELVSPIGSIASYEDFMKTPSGELVYVLGDTLKAIDDYLFMKDQLNS